MTKPEFLARCATIFDMGLLTPERIKLLERWLDFVLRYDGVHFGSHRSNQQRYLRDFDEAEEARIEAHSGLTLASDADGYALIRFGAVLGHPCQPCATNPKEWHTRVAFCPHKAKETPDAF